MSFTKEDYNYNIELSKADVPTKIVVGSRSGKFVPNINMSKWNDEAWLNINFPAVVAAEQAIIDKDVISQTIGDYTFQYSAKPDESLEWEIILEKRPPTNDFIFNLDFSPNLVFYQQPPITQKEIDFGATRPDPDNVTGSYAIYLKDKINNQYKTGKFGHLFMPILTDADGKTILPDSFKLDPDAKTLTISVDSKWLDKATYPVTIDPNLGSSTKGATGHMANNNYAMANRWQTDASGGTTDALHAWVYVEDAGLSFKMVLFTDHAGAPNRPQAVMGTPVSNSPAYLFDGQKDLAYVQALDASTYYWVAYLPFNSYMDVWYDSTGGEDREKTQAGYAFDDPWPDSGDESWGGYRWSTWASYAAGDGASTPEASLKMAKGPSGSGSGCFLPKEDDAIMRKRQTED